MNFDLTSWRGRFHAIAAAFFGVSLCCQSASALVVQRTSSTNLYVDFDNSIDCNYAAYRITNNDGVTYSNLWVSIDSFNGTYVKLGGSDPGRYPLGTLGPNSSRMVFFYLQATNTSPTPQTHAIKIHRGYPSALVAPLHTQIFGLRVDAITRNNANKIAAINYSPAQPVIGSQILITVDGATSQLSVGDGMAFTPAGASSWNAAAFELIGTVVTLTNDGTIRITNTLYFPRPAGGGNNISVGFRAEYLFRAVASTVTNTALSPVGSFANGNPSTLSHSQVTAGSIPTVPPPTNATLLTLSADATQRYTNEVVSLSVTLTNSSVLGVLVDRIEHALPAHFVYVPNSSRFAGVPAADPVIAGQQLTWFETYPVAAESSVTLEFLARAMGGGYATNSVVAFSGQTQLDSTLSTADNAPATAVVRVLLEPFAAGDTVAIAEDAEFSIAAPGLLGNDIEPNGFPITVQNYTQPAHGSVVVSSNGAFVYVPAANYSGPDSFTYTVTNGNGRAASAVVSITVNPVNDAPMLNPIASMQLDQDAGEQTVALTGISAGASNETGQTIFITATSSNPGLIPNPTVLYANPAATGSLTFTSTPHATGEALITVVVSDNGGTENAGIAAITNTFLVSVVAVVHVWGPGERLLQEVSNAAGAAGTGYDHLALTGTLDIRATSTNPFTIDLKSMMGGVPGLAQNFDAATTNDWVIATASNGVTGFDPGKFLMDTSGFSNDLRGGTFGMALSPDGNSVRVVFIPNHAPVAAAAGFGRAWGTSMRIPVANLVSGFVADPDGDACALERVETSTNGTSIRVAQGMILLAPTNNRPESFGYVIRDVRNYRPGDTVLLATNWISISITNGVSAAQGIAQVNGVITLRFAGVPGYAYTIERSESISGGEWVAILTTNAPPGGIWTVTDPGAPMSSAFYRIRQN